MEKYIIAPLIGIVILYIFWDGFLWIFLYIFVPKKVTVAGQIISIEKKSGLYLSALQPDGNTNIGYNMISIPDDLYLIEVRTTEFIKPICIKVSLDLFKQIENEIKAGNKLFFIPCYKYEWSKRYSAI